MKAITPEEVMDKKTLPDEVIEAFNDLIIEKFDGKEAFIRQEEAIQEILEKFDGAISRQCVFDRHYLDVEHFYRMAGWNVYFDKADNTENSSFTFTVMPIKKKA